MTDIDSDQTLRTQAIDWIAQEASGGLNEQQRQECEQWRARSSRHWQAWKEAEQVWHLMAQMQPATDGDNDVSEAVDAPVSVSSGQSALTGSSRWRRRYTVAGLCAGLVLAVFIMPWQRALTVAPEQPVASSAVLPAQLHTNRSVAVRQIILADGSRVYLNAATQISTQFTSSQRRIELLKGEALFEVVQDPNRPFIVRSGSTQTTAVGTAFTVRRRGLGASVVVTEGAVAVSLERSSGEGVALGRSESDPERDPLMDASAARVIVQANQSVSSDGTDLSAVMSVNAANHVAWHRGVLMFRDTPLRDVIAEINRYSPYRIEADLAHRVDEPITGTFFIERLDEDMGSLVSGFGLRVVKQEPGLLQLALAHPSRP